MSTWLLAEAESHFREVVEKALREGPQTISDNGTGVVVVSADEYQAMAKARPSFKDHLLGGPRVDDFMVDSEADQDCDR